MRIALYVSILMTLAASASAAYGQRMPFFAAGGTGFDPEISVVNSGAVLDAQPVVSNDLKYVTIGARTTSSSLLALRDFTFARGNNARLGFVGGAAVNLDAANVAGARVPANLPANARQNVVNALDRRGVMRIAPLAD